VATGTVTDPCYPRHRHQEFLKFLKKVAAAYPSRPRPETACPGLPSPNPPTIMSRINGFLKIVSARRLVSAWISGFDRDPWALLQLVTAAGEVGGLAGVAGQLDGPVVGRA
jgi:hypothetical protein